MEESPARPNPVIELLAILTVTYAATYVGHSGLMRGAGDWYLTLARPAWAPPVWMLGLVSLALAGLLGSAAWRLRQADSLGGAPALLLAVILALTSAWPWLLFAWNRLFIAFLALILLALCSAAAVAAFSRAKAGAGNLLLPSLGWYFFLSCAGFALWRMNV